MLIPFPLDASLAVFVRVAKLYADQRLCVDLDIGHANRVLNSDFAHSVFMVFVS